ncbi:LysR family transcriptional regulator [Vibrio crassostreae]|uniref:LysR family transcriptional regulator n=1 Tax=Vibrio crassostreae TaxID=246167 RepID=UPI001B30ACB5|nr:LysR family transcriptional regulator [Vibrio crassostreae]
MNLTELDHLKKLFALTSLAELKNQEAVAIKMGVSQSSVSRWKRDLEKYYTPEKLFLVEEADGDGESWVPTPFLESLIFLVDGVRQRYHNLATRDSSKEITGRYKVYLPPVAISTFGDVLLDALIEECPNVEWSIEGADSNKVTYGLSEPDVAFAIHVALDSPSPHIMSKKIISARRKVYARKGHPIFDEKVDTFETLQKYDIVAVDVGMGKTAQKSLSLFKLDLFKPKYTVETLHSAVHLIRGHDAICIGGAVYFAEIEGVEAVDNLSVEVERKLEVASEASSTYFYAHKDDTNLISWARIVRSVMEHLAERVETREQFDAP